MKVNRQLSNRLDARCCWRTLIGYSVGVCHEACGFCDNALPSGLAHITNYIKALSRTRTVFSSQDHHLLLQSPGWTQFYLARQPSAHIGSKRQRKFLFIIYTLEMVLNSLQVGHPVFFFLTQWVEIWETLAMESFVKCAAKWLCWRLKSAPGILPLACHVMKTEIIQQKKKAWRICSWNFYNGTTFKWKVAPLAHTMVTNAVLKMIGVSAGWTRTSLWVVELAWRRCLWALASITWTTCASWCPRGSTMNCQTSLCRN